MHIKLKVDYNDQHKKGGDGEGLPDDLKARLVKVGLAEKVSPAKAAPAVPAKPKAKAKPKTTAPQAAPEGHRPLAGPIPTPSAVAEASE